MSEISNRKVRINRKKLRLAFDRIENGDIEGLDVLLINYVNFFKNFILFLFTLSGNFLTFHIS